MLRFIILALTLSLSSSIFAQSTHVEPSNFEAFAPVEFEKVIFFSDFENDLYYIDFEAVGSPIVRFDLLLKGELVQTEDVKELPINTIYEIDLSKLKPGTYTIELITIYEDSILQEFDITQQNELTKGDN